MQIYYKYKAIVCFAYGVAYVVVYIVANEVAIAAVNSVAI